MKDQIKKAWEASYRYRLWLLAVLLGVNTLVVLDVLMTAVKGDRYFVAHEDEVIYYGSAKVFAETGSVQAESCITEDVSPVGQINWYGPGYSVVYGMLRLLFGDGLSVTIWVHFALALLAVFATLLISGKPESNLLAANAFFATTQFTVFIFSYFPETLHFFMATILAGVLVKIHETSGDEKRMLARWQMIYICLCLTFMLCRITMIFWLAGLIPLAANRKQLLHLVVLFIGGVLVALVYMKLFIAPAYASDMHKINELYKLNLWSFAQQSIKAFVFQLKELIFKSGQPSYLVLGLMVIVAVLFFVRRSRVSLAAFLIASILVITLLCYYTASPFFFVKQTAMLVPLLLIVAIRESPSYVKYWIGLSMVVLIPSTWAQQAASIAEHQAAYANKANNISFEEALQSLPDHIDKSGSVVILWCYSEYDYGHAAQALLPYSTRNGEPIMYTTNIVFDSNAPNEERFRLHNKLKVDYILSRQPIDWKNLNLKLQTSFFFFYELNKSCQNC